MKAVKSERGMILVTVLMLIVIFSVIGITIINFTVTNAKQTSNIEKDMQSVDIAEMGIIRYRSELLVKMNDILTEEIVKAIQAIETTNAEKAKSNAIHKDFIPINSDTILKIMDDQGAFNPSKFNLGYNSETKYLISSEPNYAYTIIEEPIDITAPGFPKLIQLTMKSKGYSVDDTNEISADFTFNLAEIIEAHLKPGTIVEVEKGTPQLIEKPVLDLMVNGQNLPEVSCNTGWLINRCKPNSAKNPEINGHINGVDGALSGNVELAQGDINVSDSKLYMKSGNLIVGTVESISNSKLHSSGNITFNNSNKGGFAETEISGKDISFGTIKVFNNNKVYAEGNIQFDNINTSNSSKWKSGGIIKSVIYSNGNIIFNNINEGFDQSSVYAGGNLIFKHNLNGQSHINNTKIRVYGNLEVGVINTLIKNNSIIWVDGNISIKTVNGDAIDSTSFVCAKGNVDKKFLDKALVVGKDAQGNDIKNIQANVKSFENCGKPTQIVNESKPSALEPIFSSLEKALDEAKYMYK